MENIDPRGWLERKEISSLIRSSWALLITSEYEALPMAVLEAMHHGLPIIGSEAVDGIYKNSGLIIRDDDPEIWASKIGDLLDNPERWTKMSTSGPLESTIFDSMKVRNQWLELYNSIVNTHYI